MVGAGFGMEVHATTQGPVLVSWVVVVVVWVVVLSKIILILIFIIIIIIIISGSSSSSISLHAFNIWRCKQRRRDLRT